MLRFRTRWPALTVMALVSFVLITCEDTGCNEKPFDATSPAARILADDLSVPVVAGDDYVKDNLTFSWVRVNMYDRDGTKSIKAYCDAKRVSDVDRDSDTEDVELELRFRMLVGGETIIDTTRSGDFDGDRVLLNDLCEGGVDVPEKIVVTKIRVTRTPISVEAPVEIPEEPTGR